MLKNGDIISAKFDDDKTESQRTKLTTDDIIDFLPIYKSATDRTVIHYVTSDKIKKNPGISIKFFGNELEFKSKFAHPSYKKAMMIESIKGNRESSYSQYVFSTTSSRITASSSFSPAVNIGASQARTGREGREEKILIDFD
eukprot:gnl/Chilomastix_caulleri/2121.p1 GENE.gnl/Chilomastix_caulleri/2121~~gnl/Chilomastix_caulleri/2121.p1  ORF type:complete len:142 (-),score=27.06 gnl/Chilomastix_caulleri/2121:91-516(-)